MLVFQFLDKSKIKLAWEAGRRQNSHVTIILGLGEDTNRRGLPIMPNIEFNKFSIREAAFLKFHCK